MRRDLRRRARAHQLAARLAALGPEVDDPVGGADDVEVVLDHDQRMAGGDQLAEGASAAWRCRRSAGRWWVRRTGTASRVPAVDGCSRRDALPPLPPDARPASSAALRRPTASAPAGRASGTPGRRPRAAAACAAPRAGRRRTRPPRDTVISSTSAIDLPAAAAFALHRDLQHLVAVAPAVAVRAAQIHVGQELHLHVLEAVAAAGRAAAVAGVEAERARRVAALLRQRLLGEELADGVERADVAGRDWSAWCGRSASGRPSRLRRSARGRARARCAPGASVGLPLCLSSAA